ncbi:MAG: hypothetical protein V2A53_02880 [bacterium]
MRLEELVKELKPISEVTTTLEWIQLLANHIGMAEKNDRIRITGGELCCKIYDSPEVINAFVVANRKGAKIQIISGPILSVWMKKIPPKSKMESVPKNRIIELVKDGIVELYYRESRAEIHYRVVGNGTAKIVHVESPHSPLAPAINRQKLDISAQKQKELYKVAKEEFDALIADGKVMLSSNPEKDFLVLSVDQIKELNKKAQEREIDLNSLSHSEIKCFLKI